MRMRVRTFLAVHTTWMIIQNQIFRSRCLPTRVSLSPQAPFVLRSFAKHSHSQAMLVKSTTTGRAFKDAQKHLQFIVTSMRKLERGVTSGPVNVVVAGELRNYQSSLCRAFCLNINGDNPGLFESFGQTNGQNPVAVRFDEDVWVPWRWWSQLPSPNKQHGGCAPESTQNLFCPIIDGGGSIIIIIIVIVIVIVIIIYFAAFRRSRSG